MANTSGVGINEWDPIGQLPDHFLIIAYGLRRSGKSVLLRQLLYDVWPRIQAHAVYLFSQTASVNKEQYDYLPGGEFAVSDIQGQNLEIKLREIIQIQKNKLTAEDADQTGDGSKKKKRKRGGEADPAEEKKSESTSKKSKKGGDSKPDQKSNPREFKQALHREQHKKMRQQKSSGVDVEELIAEAEETPKTLEECKHVLVILDDCCNDQAVRSSPSLSYLSTCGRHLKISIIILSQVVHGSGSVPPVVRTQADTIVMVAQPRSIRERELVSEQYLTAENKEGAKKEGLRLLEEVTAIPFQALVITTNDNAARTYDEYCFTYGPVPFPFPHDEWRCGLDVQFEEAKDDQGAQHRHDFFKKHPDRSDRVAQTDVPAVMAPQYGGRNQGPSQMSNRFLLRGKIGWQPKPPGTNGNDT
jgi:hypothetical protein